MACRYARSTDEYHGWECTITEGACMFMYPNQKACHDKYGEPEDPDDYEAPELDLE